MLTHRDVVPLLPDLLESRLAHADVAPVWSHVAGCVDCQQVVTAMHQVRAAVVTHGAQVFAAHPSSDELVRFALVDPDLPTSELARLGDHVRGCADCRVAVELTRAAERATARRFLHPAPADVSRWAPALVLLVALAYPAYLGIARYPELGRSLQARSQQVQDLKAENARVNARLADREREHAAPAWPGPAQLLYLPATTRGVGVLPEVVWDASQRYQPIVIQHQPFAGTVPRGAVEIAILDPSSSRAVWSERRDAAEFWDPANSALVVLVPARVLAPGTWKLEVRRDGTTTYSASFRTQPRKNP